MNLGPEINLQVVIKSQRLNFLFDHNGKTLAPNKTGPGTRTGDDGRSGGLDGRHLQRAGGGDDTHAGVPGNDC